MRASVLVVAGVVAGPLAAAAGAIGVACSSKGDAPVHVSIAPSLVFPRDVLQNATAVSLTVYNQNSGVTCNASTGQASGVTSSTPTVTSSALGPCPAGSAGKFCGALTITESTATLVFAASAQSKSGATIAYGCAAQVVNAASLNLAITMIRNIPPATCGNGIIEPTEQCDPPGAAGGADIVCDSQCHSMEETLSTGVSAPGGPPFFLWPAQSGQNGELFAFFTSDVGQGTSHLNVAMRAMSDALEPVSTPAAAASALLAPNDSNGPFPPVPIAFDQSQPSAAFVLGTYFYVFTDDAAGTPDIHMRSFDGSLATTQSQSAPIGINGPDGGGGEPNQQVSPSVAVGGSGSLYIAWQDVSAAQVVGRTYAPTGGTLGPSENVLSTGTGNENVRVVGTASGWIVVWDDGTQIKMRVIAGDGTPSGPESVVSGASHTGTQDHPGVAVLGDGRLAIVWADHGTSQGTDIFVQRYDANFVPVAGDQTTAINNVVAAGDQIAPSVAGSTANGGSFVVAWLDTASGQVRGRVLDGTTGFGFNPLDGTANEFQASIAAGQTRENPVVAIGGAGPSAAIGWDVAGVVSARRFPMTTASP